MIFFSWLLAIACLIFFALTIIVIKNRGRTKQILHNNQNDPALGRAIRAQGNFIEITPFAFAALWLMTQTAINPLIILITGCIFLIGRIMHAFSLIYFEPVYNIIKFRIIAMMTSFSTILFGVGVFFFYTLT